MTMNKANNPINPEYPKVVSRAEWLAARKALLAKEKELTRYRDAVNAERRRLPMVKIEKDYVFDAPGGKKSLGKLFADKSQLMVYHFMFDRTGRRVAAAARSCPITSTAPTGISRRATCACWPSLARLLPRSRNSRSAWGWRFEWVSSLGSDFNFDYGVSFPREEVAKDKVNYNYEMSTAFDSEELPGLSVFYKDAAGGLFHTYSTYARGLDMLVGAYNFLDLAPKGRQEDWEEPPGRSDGPFMHWVRHHDRYENGPKTSASCCSSGTHHHS